MDLPSVEIMDEFEENIYSRSKKCINSKLMSQMSENTQSIMGDLNEKCSSIYCRSSEG